MSMVNFYKTFRALSFLVLLSMALTPSELAAQDAGASMEEGAETITNSGSRIAAGSQGSDAATSQAQAVPQITSVTVPTLTFNSGGEIEIWFTTDGPFSPGNVFTAQISNLVGDFSNPRKLGEVSSTSQGVIVGKLPCEMGGGIGYRVRVIASAPRINGPDNGVAIAIRPRIPFEVRASGPTTFCPGDSVTLTGNDGFVSYRWNTGDTTRTIVARHNGIYTLYVRDSNECGLVGRATVTVRIPPKPPIRIRNGVVLETDFGFPTYQWNLNGNPIPDATERTHKISGIHGIYTVTVTDTNGCYGTSDQKKVGTSGAAWERTDDGGVNISMSPARDRLTIETKAEAHQRIAIALCDMNGRELLTIDEAVAAGVYRRDVPLDALPAGAYLLRMKVGDRVIVEKVVR